jgi:hypothetical protein
MKHEDNPSKPPINRPADDAGRQGAGEPSLSTRGLVMVFAAVAIALVLGYLLLNKLVDISQKEDCALARRYNCGSVEVPR